MNPEDFEDFMESCEHGHMNLRRAEIVLTALLRQSDEEDDPE